MLIRPVNFDARPPRCPAQPLVPRQTVLFAILLLLFTAAFAPAQQNIAPPSAAADKLVAVSAIPQYSPAAPGQPFALAVILDIRTGWHLYANPKQGQFGLDTVISPQPTPSVKFGPVQYPPGQIYTDKSLDASNHIYKDRTICFVPLEILPTEESSVTINLTLKGQLCSDAGVCRLWNDTAVAHLTLAASPAVAAAQQPPLFRDFNPAAAWATGNKFPAPPIEPEPAPLATGWLTAVLLALAAGLIMNVMPCVLPLIPVIVLTLIKQCSTDSGPADRAKTIRVGLSFAGGILIVFILLAVLMSVFKLLWGQQFQSTGFIFALFLIVLVLSLSMFGLFEIVLPQRLSNLAGVRRGYLGAFTMGALATILATPCGAPLLTPVLAFSLAKPLPVTIVVFLIIGAGMALPYILLTASPRLINRVPRSGPWMTRLQQVIGFIMLGFAVYLLLLLPTGWHKPLLYYSLLVAFCVWLGLGVVNRFTAAWPRRLARAAALFLLIAGSYTLAVIPKTTTPAAAGLTASSTAAGDNWLVQLNYYRQNQQTVIVKFTADWCKNCAALDKLIYHNPAFRDKLRRTHAALVIADWTYSDPAIKQMILDLAGPGQALPFAAVFPGKDPDHPILLRDFYSLEETLTALDNADRITNPHSSTTTPPAN